MNPRVEAVCKLFVQTFFADLGATEEMTIGETKAFLKKQKIDVEVSNQFLNEPSTEEKEPVPSIELQQVEVRQQEDQPKETDSQT